jgi:hypothetical protein
MSLAEDGDAPGGRWRLTARDIRDALLSLIPTAAALLLASWVIEELDLSVWAAVVVAALVAVVDVAVRPALRLLLTRAGAVGALLVGLLTQLLVVELALTLAPGAQHHSPGTVALTLLLVAVFGALGRWLLGATDKDYLVADLIRRAQRRRRRTGPAVPAAVGAPGVVIVQLDGLPHPVLMHGILSGNLPTLSRWVRSGSYTPAQWWARLPSTTPASQAGLLHGNNDGIPAFRWYEKAAARLMVANRPADAALIEQRISDGRGLLAHGGVSISNLFTGDAATNLMVMSRAGQRRGLGSGSAYVRFFASPFVVVRALVVTVAEMVKELYQARRQRVRGVVPRIPRHLSYVALRGVTNVLLRDLNVALVADQMMLGTPVVFVDFVDYDEIAHHAGITRPESLDSLAGLDGVLATLERVAAATPRSYRFVVLSDHGQSQGDTFLQLSGRTLEDVVGSLVGATGATVAETEDVESWGPLNALLSDVLDASATTSRWAQRRASDEENAGVIVGPQRGQATAVAGAQATDLVVVGSGNLGLVWFPRLPGRVPLELLQEHFPALIPGVVAEPGVGFVVVHSGRGPLAVGPHGVHVLGTGAVEGVDPLRAFGHRAAADLARVAAMSVAPDLLVHSDVNALTGEVHAFEELVGCHGGLGGWQNHAVLLHPADWPIDDDLLDRSVPGEAVLYGADAVHRQLVRWLERSGSRPPAEPLVPDLTGPAAR